MSVSTKPPAGMRDFLPDELDRREFVLDRIRQVYRRHGFRQLETPTLERIEILTGKYGDEGDQLMFKVLKRGAKLESALGEGASGEGVQPAELSDMGLRYDLTVPLCRVVAQYQHDLPRVFRAFQLRPVWRADRPAKGRFREFYQCDVDILGTTSVVAECEAVSAAAAALKAIGVTDFTVRINDRRLLTAIATSAGIDESLHVDTLVALDKRDKIGLDGVRDELAQRGISAGSADHLFAVLEAGALPAGGGESHADPKVALAAVAEAIGEAGGELADEAVERLVELFDLLAAVGLSPPEIAFDPSLARGLGYYTGPIFEINVPDFSGSIGGGGRYDDLVGMFLGRPVPACGISLGVERLLMLLDDRGLFPSSLSERGVFITQFRDVSPAFGLTLARRLRDAGIEADVFPDAIQLGKQFKQAEQSGARVVAVIGPDEAVEGRVGLKRMATGDQVSVSLDDAVATVREWL